MKLNFFLGAVFSFQERLERNFPTEQTGHLPKGISASGSGGAGPRPWALLARAVRGRPGTQPGWGTRVGMLPALLLTVEVSSFQGLWVTGLLCLLGQLWRFWVAAHPSVLLGSEGLRRGSLQGTRETGA